MLNNKQKNTLGIILILIGIFSPLASVPLSSAYDGQDNFILRIVRVLWTGEIVLREAMIEVVPDRDEQLFKALMEYRMEHRELESLPEDQIIDTFYNARYKDLMPRVEFNLKLEKKQVVTIKKKMAVPNLYIFVYGLFMIIVGAGINILVKRKNA
jgi:hypothetical protein